MTTLESLRKLNAERQQGKWRFDKDTETLDLDDGEGGSSHIPCEGRDGRFFAAMANNADALLTLWEAANLVTTAIASDELAVGVMKLHLALAALEKE